MDLARTMITMQNSQGGRGRRIKPGHMLGLKDQGQVTGRFNFLSRHLPRIDEKPTTGPTALAARQSPRSGHPGLSATAGMRTGSSNLQRDSADPGHLGALPYSSQPWIPED